LLGPYFHGDEVEWVFNAVANVQTKTMTDKPSCTVHTGPKSEWEWHFELYFQTLNISGYNKQHVETVEIM